MKINTIESERVFSALKSSISKLKKENSEKENPQSIELIAEFDFGIKKYSEENFPAKFSILNDESQESNKIIIHTVLNGILYNKTLLKKVEENQARPANQGTTTTEPPKENSVLNSSAMDQLNQMLSMRDEMMNRLLLQGDKLNQARQEMTEKSFLMQMEALKTLQDQKVDTILELSKQKTELEVEKAKITYQQGTQFWQELVKEGISVFKENPKIILDAVDFIKLLKAKPVED